MQSSSLCDLFLTLYTCLAARDQTDTGLYWRSVATRPRKRIPLPIHPALPRSCLCLWASQYKTFCSSSTWWTRRDQNNQAGSALREGENLTGIFKYLSATCRGGRAGLFTEARNICSCMGNSSHVAEFSPCAVRVDSRRKGTELLPG